MKNHTAIHEAGHAVAHRRLEVDAGMVSIIPEDDLAGSALASDSIWNESDARDQVLCLCAGYASLVATGESHDTAVEGCESDFHKATEIIKEWKLGSLDEWLLKSIEFMRSQENIKAVGMVADALMELGSIDSDYYACLIELADGEITQAEWERYLSVRAQMGM